MGRILVYGSINTDRICRVPQIAPPGATVCSAESSSSPGGKGANQAVAAALAGAPTSLVGSIGADGTETVREIARRGVDVENVQVVDQPTGTAFIQVDPQGENAIVIDPAANHTLDDEKARALLTDLLEPADLLLLQNETTGLKGAIQAGIDRDASIWLNTAPSERSLRALPLEKLHALVMNEEEALQLADGADPLEELAQRAPSTLLVLTKGENGGQIRLGELSMEWNARKIEAVNTVGCGDAFIGVLAASVFNGLDLNAALDRSACAAAITATRNGAIPALPDAAEIESFQTSK